MNPQILILDFGSQYTQLIARRVRELNVYCEIHPYNKVPANTGDFKGVILSGSPSSVREANPPKPDLTNIKGKMPLLGVCYGAQYLAHFFGVLVLCSLASFARGQGPVAPATSPTVTTAGPAAVQSAPGLPAQAQPVGQPASQPQRQHHEKRHGQTHPAGKQRRPAADWHASQ